MLNDLGDSVTRIDPATGKKGETIKVEDPYNMYYTPDGKYAIVVAERKERLDFINPQTMKLEHALSVPCRGVDHMDFSADGRYLIASCEFSGTLVKVDVEKQSVIGELKLPRPGMPQDVKLSPDGTIFYVADMEANGVYEIDGDDFKDLGFIPTGKGAHGLYTSRDSRVLYVSNRGEGSISLLDFAERRVVDEMEAPGRGQPRYGRSLRRRQGPVAVGALQPGSLRHRHRQRQPAGPHQSGKGSPRLVRVPATRPLLARAHGHLSVGAANSLVVSLSIAHPEGPN